MCCYPSSSEWLSCCCRSLWAHAASRWSRPLLMLAALGSLLGAGCSLLPSLGAQEAYVGPGCVAEVRKPATVQVWVTDAKTGDMKRAYVQVYPGWLVGPPEPAAKESAVR